MIYAQLFSCELTSSGEFIYIGSDDYSVLTSVTAPHSNDSSDNRSLSSANWTDLSGHHLSAPPTRKGVYIMDGKKVVVK